MTNIVGGGWFETQLRLKPGTEREFASSLQRLGGSIGVEFASQFTASASAELGTLGTNIERALGTIDPPKVTIAPDVDAAQLESELDAAAGAADATVQVGADVDAAQLATEVGAAADAADTTVNVDVDVDAEQIGTEVGAAADAADTTVNVDVDVDAAQVSTEVDAAVGAASGRTVQVEVETDAEQISPEIDAAVGAASGRTVQVEVDIDAAGVSAAATSAGRGIVSAISTAAVTAGSALRTEVGQGISEGGALGAANLQKGIAAAGIGFGAATIIGDLTDVDRKIRETAALFGQPAAASGGLITSLTGEVKDLAGELGILQTDIVPALYDSVSAGVGQSDLPNFLENVGKFAIAGAADLSVAGDAVTTALNAWQLSASETESVTDSLYAAVQGGKTTVDQLGASLFQAAPAAASLGVPLQEVNAALATLTSQGVPTSVAATRLTANFTAMLSKTKELTPVFNELGYATAEAAIKSEGLQFAVDAVNAAAGGSATELQKLLGSTEAVQAVQILAGTGAAKFSDELERQAAATGVVSEAFKVLDTGPAATMRRLQETAQSLGLAVGETLAPAFDAVLPLFGAVEGIITTVQPVVGLLADGIGVLAGAFDALPGPMQSVIVGAVGVNAVLGKFDVFGKAASGLLSLATTASSAGPQLAGVSSGLLNAGAAVDGFGAKAAGAGGGLRGLISAAGGLGTLGPIALGAGAAIGAIAIAWQQGKQRAAEFQAEVDELTGAIIDQNGALKEGADGWNEYIVNQSRFQARNQIDDLAELGITATEVSEAMLGSQDAMRDIALRAADAGEAGNKAGIQLSDGMREMLETTDDVPAALLKIWEASNKGGGEARGNVDLLRSLLEAMGVTAETTAQQLDKIKIEGADKYGQDTIDRLNDLEEAGKSSTEILQILGDEGRLSAEKLKEIGDAVPSIDELVGSAENAQAALEKLQVTQDILPPETQTRLEGLVAAGTDAADILAILTKEGLLTDEVLSQIGVEGLARIAPEADTAASGVARLVAAARSLPTLLENVQTFDFGNLITFSAAGLDEDALNKLSEVRGEMEAYAAENSIPIEVVAQFGESSLERVKSLSTSAAEDISGVFQGSFNIDFGKDVIPSLEQGLDKMSRVVEERANFAENIIELQREGFGQLVGVIRQASPEIAMAWAQQAVDASDEQRAAFAEQVAGFSTEIANLQTEAIQVANARSSEWQGLGLNAADQFRTGIGAFAGITDQVIAPELAKLGLQAANFAGFSTQLPSTIGTAFSQVPPAIAAQASPFATAMGAVAAGGISGFSAPLQTGLVAPIGTAFSQVPPAIAAQQGPISAAAGTAGTTTSASFGVPLTTGMQTQTQTAMTGAQTTIAGAVPGLTGASTQAGRAVPTGFSAGLPGMDPATRGAFQSVNGIIAASNGILGAAANLSGQQIGRRFGEGISYGMESTRAEISAKAAQLVAAASAATTAAAQIKSPSRLFAAHGRDMGLGAIVGLESTFGDATTAGTELVNAVAPNWDTATASAQQAAETITTTFSGVTLIPESEAERSLSLIQSIQSEIDKITLEDVQGRGNVLTAFFDDAMNATINDGFNAFFQDAANQAAAVLDSRGTSAGGAYVAGTGSLVAGQAPTAEAMVVLLQQIRDGLANPGTTTINQQIAAPVTPMLDVYSPVTANRHADMMADRIRQSLEYSNQGER